MRDERLVLPRNSSLSMTLSGLRTRTAVRFDPDLSHDCFVLNGVSARHDQLRSVSEFLDLIRSQAGIAVRAEVRSVNNFPTASGLASSASGFAALAGAASAAAGLRPSLRALSQLARRGSGSASRSIFGGFVEWQAGIEADGRDCYARPLFRGNHWPELRDLVVLIRDAPEKGIRSAEAMQATVGTSPAYSQRLRTLPARLGAIRSALKTRNAERFLSLMIEECDDFRHVCETTVPSLDYLTVASRAVLAEVLDLNRSAGRTVAGYTHDAGAHVHLFTLARDVARLRARIEGVRGVAGTRLLSAGPPARLMPGSSAAASRRGRVTGFAGRSRGRAARVPSRRGSARPRG